jgi:DNA-binding beta-propeller fold protein YncE
MYVTDGNTIREIDLVTHAVTTRFGSTTAGFVDGLGTAARFNTLSSLAADSGHLYATDLVNGAIRVIDLATSEVTTLHVTDGAGTPVGIGGYGTLALSADGFLYVTAMGSLKRIYLATGKVDEIIGTPGAIAAVPGPLSSASLNRWRGELMFDSHGTLYLSQESGILRLVELP